MHRERAGPPRVEPSDPLGCFTCCGHCDPLHVGRITEATVFQRTCPRCGPVLPGVWGRAGASLWGAPEREDRASCEGGEQRGRQR